MKRFIKEDRGFTLIEIMVVLIIIGLLAGIVVPRLMGRTEEAKRTKAAVQIKNFQSALDLYRLDSGIYPSTDQGLQALVEKPAVGEIPRNWKDDGYIDKIPKDPWGDNYIYLSPGVHGDYDLYSYGADGEEGGDGKDADIQSWNIE
ncbi:MAG: type II secretion system protein GspG [Nitrospirae bacterium RIFCSPLOWO2_02_42_7]|nr:MAG: type II secretion system protein GspG [Nitrospirae bacterium RIFCSPLOWO2_02_42_7]OGW58326.1 MAG: type II secretion system protein GspG [Nitrospirae bacterium RIFCSPHIGHO2_02_FULL_42_12]